MLQRPLSIFALTLLLASCAAVIPSFDSGTACEAAAFTVTDNFAAARRGRCVALSDDHVRITILPESDGYINDSPWYAMKVVPNFASTATITIEYRGGHHRYQPKTSVDGLHWVALDDGHVTVASDGSKATLTMDLGDEAVWLAAQEIITPAFYDVWNRKMEKTGVVDRSVLGESRNKMPVTVLNTTTDADDVLFLVGRQHPAEVTGAIGLWAFYEILAADTELAIRFRQHVKVVAVPLLNPDGVIGGNWRHNLGGTDLNRDWGPFEQPETKLMKALLDDLDASGKKIRMFLDFHSTQKNVFYTQNNDFPTKPPLFTYTWLENARPRIQNYDYVNQENPVESVGVAKNYMYNRYGIPSSTYEVGDETDRTAIREAAKVFAEELMQLMLAQSYE
jgi:predicted deacylase